MKRLLLISALWLCGCLRWLPAPTPMPQEEDLLVARGKARCLVVLLPGAGDRSPIFRDEGVLAKIRKTGLSVDLISADASPGYYANGVMPLRLEKDVIAPARTRGYEQIWLVGISMGGFGTFHYASQYPAHLDGIFAMSPWLGREETIAEIIAAGGLAMWKPPAVAALDDETFAPQTWGFVARVTSGESLGPEIYLGYGASDTRVGSPQFLADVLPKDHVYRASGGHEWAVWRDVLDQFLAGSVLKQRCAP